MMMTACLFFHPFFSLLVLGIYFAPTLLAAHRNHSNVTGIFLLNFLLGWTFIGWVAALIWTFSEPSFAGLHPAYGMPFGYPASVRCQRCGCGLAPGQAFCTNCGARS